MKLNTWPIITQAIQLLKFFIGDLRLLCLIIPALMYMYANPHDWPQSNTIMYFTSVTIFLAGVSHITRKIYFPYVDMRLYANEALKTPTGAATVFLSVSIVLCMLLYTLAIWAK